MTSAVRRLWGTIRIVIAGSGCPEVAIMEDFPETDCLFCHRTGKVPGVPEKKCDYCGGTGKRRVEELPPGSNPFSG